MIDLGIGRSGRAQQLPGDWVVYPFQQLFGLHDEVIGGKPCVGVTEHHYLPSELRSIEPLAMIGPVLEQKRVTRSQRRLHGVGRIVRAFRNLDRPSTVIAAGSQPSVATTGLHAIAQLIRHHGILILGALGDAIDGLM